MKLNKKDRSKLKMIYDGHCAYCGEILGEKWYVDHIKPVMRNSEWVKNDRGFLVSKPNGTMQKPENDNIDNLNPSCIACNINKGCIDLESWRSLLKNYVNTLNKASNYSIYRHAKRFGLIVENDIPVTFFFEKFDN